MSLAQQFDGGIDPRLCNTGVRSGDSPLLTGTAEDLRFDAYACTFDGVPCEVVELLQRDIPQLQGKRLPRGMLSYPDGVELTDGCDKAFVLWRGPGLTEVHVRTQGELSEPIARWARWRYGDHRVARADVCLDLRGEGLFDRICALALDLSECRGVGSRTEGDWIGREKGRTLYLGSRESAVMLRIYEKGHQLRQTGKDPEAPLDLVRVEVECKPAKEGKRAASRAVREALFRSGSVSNALADVIFGREGIAQRVSARWRRSDDERAFAAMVNQYGAMLARQVGDLGDWHSLGATIGAAVERVCLRQRGEVQVFEVAAF